MLLWNIHGNCKNEDGSPISSYFATQRNIIPFYPFHWHEEAELVYVKSGSVRFCCDGVWSTANEGNAIVFRPFCLHCFKSILDTDVELEALTINFRTATNDGQYSLLKGFAPMFSNIGAKRVLVSTDNAVQNAFCVQLLNCINKFNYQNASPEDFFCLLKILSELGMSGENNLTADKQCHAVRLALEYIGDNYQNKFSVEDIAHHCGYSHFYIMKLFVAFTELSCVDYTNCFRLTLAKELLCTDQDKIKDIARKVGFENVSYFNRQFLRLYGKTPAQLRQEQQKRI